MLARILSSNSNELEVKILRANLYEAQNAEKIYTLLKDRFEQCDKCIACRTRSKAPNSAAKDVRPRKDMKIKSLLGTSLHEFNIQYFVTFWIASYKMMQKMGSSSKQEQIAQFEFLYDIMLANPCLFLSYPGLKMSFIKKLQEPEIKELWVNASKYETALRNSSVFMRGVRVPLAVDQDC